MKALSYLMVLACCWRVASIQEQSLSNPDAVTVNRIEATLKKKMFKLADEGIQDKVYTTNVLFTSRVSSVVECGGQCNLRRHTCFGFIVYGPTCTGYGTLTDSYVPAPGALAYVSVYAP